MHLYILFTMLDTLDILNCSQKNACMQSDKERLLSKPAWMTRSRPNSCHSFTTEKLWSGPSPKERFSKLW